MLHTYTAFGLGIHSELPLPELAPLPAPCDLRIRLDGGPTPPPGRSRWLELSREKALLYLEGTGMFKLLEGREIVLEPLGEARHSLLRMYLLGTVMAILLYQRGRLALHASSVAIGGRAVAFLAESGRGKSSLAAAMLKRGHLPLSDDVTPVEFAGGTAQVYPGCSYLKVDPQVAALLGQDARRLDPIDPAESKLRWDFPAPRTPGPIPLTRVFVLEEGQEPGIHPLRPQEAVIELIRNSYPTRLLRASDAQHLAQCGQLARGVKVARLRRSACLSDLPDLARFVEKILED
jgi:hypothetical protein